MTDRAYELYRRHFERVQTAVWERALWWRPEQDCTRRLTPEEQAQAEAQRRSDERPVA